MKYILFFGICLLLACNKDNELSTPDFEVSTTAATYKKGEAVLFTFKGNPQLISVYTGESGKDYTYREGRTQDVSGLNLAFSSAVANDGAGTPQTGMFSLQVSSNFNGDYASFANLQAATWTDVTDRLPKQEAATTATSTLATPAEGIDLSDLRVAGKPLYIAFRYNIRPQSINGIWRIWTFQGFSLTGNTTSGKQTLGNMTSTAFRVVQKNPEITSRTATSATTLTLRHTDLALDPGAAETATENWIISQAFSNVNRIDFGPDLSTPIQGGTSAVEKKDFSYTFAKAGQYSVYFVAANVSLNGKMETVRKVDLTITE
jgi:predicted heme/steroid binding protein